MPQRLGRSGLPHAPAHQTQGCELEFRSTVHDSVPYLRRLDRQRERFRFQVQAVGLDAGYATAALAQGLEERGFTE